MMRLADSLFLVLYYRSDSYIVVSSMSVSLNSTSGRAGVRSRVVTRVTTIMCIIHHVHPLSCRSF